MRVFHAPKVILVARPVLVAEGIQELLAEYGLQPTDWKHGVFDEPGDQLPELMGRLCYGSFGPRQGRIGAFEYIENILEQGHGSVLEHANWSFVLVRGDRGLTHQVVRHRAGWAFSQESTHFIRYGLEPVPGTVEAGACLTGLDDEESAVAIKAMESALEAYTALWKTTEERYKQQGLAQDQRKTARKKAVCAAVRGLLPTALESRLGFTANSRALRHFLELRGAEDNVPSIRYMAAGILEIMKREAPATFGSYEALEGSDGHPVVVLGPSERRKV